jgi:hypothetical protein
MRLIVLLAMCSVAHADPCGTGKPDVLELRDAIADPHAVVFAGKVIAQRVTGSSFEDRVGTIDIDVTRALRGSASGRIAVPAFAAGCIPKAACLPSMFDVAKPGANVVVACLPPGVAIVANTPPLVDDVRRCLTIFPPARAQFETARDRAGAVADVVVAGDRIGCAARVVCNDAARDDAVAALALALPRLPAERRLDVALVLVEPVAAAASILGCTTPPKLFDANLHSSDATNMAIVRALLDGMLAATTDAHRHRWANLVWTAIVFWEEWDRVRVMAKLPNAARAAAMLRKLSGDDADHYRKIAAAIDGANP